MSHDDPTRITAGHTQVSLTEWRAIDARQGFRTGDRIGPYRVIRLLGEGGMGQVFLTEQIEPLKRQVALKLISQRIAGPTAEAYFEVERQALAAMSHPAIATIYDAGRTPDGYPWFAMEWIDGAPLDVWCRSARPDRDTLISVLIALARGVQHAHQRGIVHRDLKPGNVLIEIIDGHPRPKIIDFGIAVGVGGSASNDASRDTVGTGPFMSPEQRDGDPRGVDTRTDVYALGMIALLCHLPGANLDGCGTRTPARADLLALLEGMPAPSANLAPAAKVIAALPLELRFIVRRCLDPDRERRYPSAEALALDLDRWRRGDAVDAVPASRRYRLRKMVWRHRLWLASGALVTLALVVGLAAALYGLERASREAARSNAFAGFLADVLSGVDPEQARGLDQTLMRQVLDEGALRAERELGDSPDVLTDIQLVIGETYRGLADLDRAHEFAQSAYQRELTNHGADALSTLSAERLLARVLIDQGKLDQAQRHAGAAAAGLLARLGADAHATLLAQQTLGWLLRERGEIEPAKTLLEATALRATSALGPQDEVSIETRLMYSIALGDSGAFNDAAMIQQELIALRTRQLGADHPRTLSLRNSYAVSLLQAQRYAEGAAQLEALLPVNERIYGPDHPVTLTVVGNLAGALRQQGGADKIRQSGPYYRRAAESLARTLGPEHPRALMTRTNLGNYLLDSGDAAGAYRLQTETLPLIRRVIGDVHPSTAELLRGLGLSATALGHYDIAGAALDESLRIRIELFGADDRRTEDVRRGIAELDSARAGAAASAPR